MKKTHMPSACLKQAFRIVALDRCGNHSRSKRRRSNVPPKYASARRFFARLASEIFLTSLQTAFFNNLLVREETERLRTKLADFFSILLRSRCNLLQEPLLSGKALYCFLHRHFFKADMVMRFRLPDLP